MKLKVNKYLSEIENWYDLLEEKTINLIIAATGSGKTKAFISNMKQEYNVAVVCPFVSLANQIAHENDEMDRKKGLIAGDFTNYSNGIITSFHSAPKLLEMHNIDLLVIDEIHYLIDFAAFSGKVIQPFWDTVRKLQEKFPHMKVVALTATPHFIRLANFLEFNIINVEQKTPTSKPSQILVDKSWTTSYAKDHTFFAIVPSLKMGQSWATKYKGTFISSADKDSAKFESVIEGKMPSKKLFATTVLSTGISITDPVDSVYTNWLDLATIVQSSSRPRLGGHLLKVTQTPKPFFLRDGMDEPKLHFSKNYEYNFKLINDYSTWFSLQAHQDEGDLYALLYQMLWLPDQPLPLL